MSERTRMVACARAYVGVRFAHQGRNPASGLDCLGLLIAAARQAGVTLQGHCPSVLDDRHYGSRPDVHYLQVMLGTYLQPVDFPEIGDVLLLRVVGRAQHLALVSDYPAEGELGMIHAYATARCVVEHRLDAQWRSQIAQVYRLPN
jgi:cell wall-associated NlpC family hydrolase